MRQSVKIKVIRSEGFTDAERSAIVDGFSKGYSGPYPVGVEIDIVDPLPPWAIDAGCD